jgi:hypothetical protein
MRAGSNAVVDVVDLDNLQDSDANATVKTASTRVKIEGENKVHVHNIGKDSATCSAGTSGDTMFPL